MQLGMTHEPSIDSGPSHEPSHLSVLPHWLKNSLAPQTGSVICKKFVSDKNHFSKEQNFVR